jgi:hypothetical protein
MEDNMLAEENKQININEPITVDPETIEKDGLVSYYRIQTFEYRKRAILEREAQSNKEANNP